MPLKDPEARKAYDHRQRMARTQQRKESNPDAYRVCPKPPCPACGAVIERAIATADFQWSRQVYCSRQCKTRFLVAKSPSHQQRKAERGSYTRVYLTTVCAGCGIEFTALRNCRPRVFCSRSCGKKHWVPSAAAVARNRERRLAGHFIWYHKLSGVPTEFVDVLVAQRRLKKILKETPCD